MEFPFTGWILQPSFKPVEVTLVKTFGTYGSQKEYVESQSGRIICLNDIYKNKEDAIASGYARLTEQQATLYKKQENINKRKAVLDKHAV